MFSIDRNALRGAVALIAAATLGGAALAETLVVRAGGPSARAYPAGKPLPGNAKIVLKAGDMLTILDSKGTRTLRGPGNFTAEAAGAPRTNASFASLVSTKKRPRSRTGAVRDDGKPARAPSLWYVDSGKSTTMCVPAGTPVSLWRGNMTAATTVTVRNDASGQSAPATFAVGSNSVAWPAALATGEGASYTLSAPGKAPVKVRFTSLSTDLEDAASTAAALYAKGCTGQYELLVGTLEDSALASASL